MSLMQLLLEFGLVALLAVTLVQAIRLERALGVLRKSRGAMAPLVEEFDASTRQAEAAIARLHEAAEGVGRQIGRQTDGAAALKNDLAFLVERGDRLADRIDGLVRTARPLAAEPPRLVSERPHGEHPHGDYPRGERPRGEHSRGENSRGEYPRGEYSVGERLVSEREPSRAPAAPAADAQAGERARIRSQAERDLLKALRVAR